MSDAYTALEARFRRLPLLSESIGMLRWDMSVMMPPGGVLARSEQIAALKLLYHELMTNPAVAVDLDRAEDLGNLDDWQAANLQRMRRRWLHTTAVPASSAATLRSYVVAGFTDVSVPELRPVEPDRDTTRQAPW